MGATARAPSGLGGDRPAGWLGVGAPGGWRAGRRRGARRRLHRCRPCWCRRGRGGGYRAFQAECAAHVLESLGGEGFPKGLHEAGLPIGARAEDEKDRSGEAGHEKQGDQNHEAAHPAARAASSAAVGRRRRGSLRALRADRALRAVPVTGIATRPPASRLHDLDGSASAGTSRVHAAAHVAPVRVMVVREPGGTSPWPAPRPTPCTMAHRRGQPRRRSPLEKLETED
jgi:hypothetical protein